MSTVSVKPTMPAKALVPSIRSVSKHILKRRQVELLPTNQSTYSFSNNSRMEFLISSASDFVDFSSSYLRFEINCELLNNGVSDLTRSLATGGVHSMFQRIYVQTASGTIIQDYDSYNRLYALMSQITESAQYVDTAEQVCGDSVYSESYVPEQRLKDAFADTADSLSEQFTAPDGATTTTLNAEYRTVISNATINGVGGGDPTTGMVQPARKRVANATSGAKIVVTMRAMLSILNMPEYFATFLVRGGLKIVFELANPSDSLQSTSVFAGTGFTGADLVISNPRYVTTFVQPDESLMASYVQKFNAEGIVYSSLGFRHTLLQLNSGTGIQSQQLFNNARSCRFILQRIQTQTMNSANNSATDVLNSYELDSVGTGIKAGLTEYQFSSGSMYFPIYKVDTSDVCQFEALDRGLQAVGVYGDTLMARRFQPWEWHAVNTSQGNNNESLRFFIGENLSRDESILTGLDNIQVPLSFEHTYGSTFQINGANEDRHVHSFVAYDQLISISSSGVIVRS